jgi:hypothetical protein
VNVVEQFLADMKKVIPEPLWNILVFILGLAALIWTLIKSFVFIQPGFVGIRKRFGKPVLKYPKEAVVNGIVKTFTKEDIKAQKAEDKALIRKFEPAIHGRPNYIYPGFMALAPVIGSVAIINVQENVLSLSPQRPTDDPKFIAYDLPSPTLTLKMKDPYLWMMVSRDVEEQIKAIANTKLTSILRAKGLSQTLDEPDAIMTALVTEMKPLCEKYGIEPLDMPQIGPQLLDANSSWNPQSRREIAQAINARH